MQNQTTHRWYSLGDLNAFFALFLDNVVNLIILSGILLGATGGLFPKDVIFEKMIPGTALGVMFGDLAYSYLAWKMHRQGKKVTAMPLGLDTPSTVGITLFILLPAFGGFTSAGQSPQEAGLNTWYLGSAILVLIGLCKVAASFAGEWIGKIVPSAGLLGSMAGIGIVWLTGNYWAETFHLPYVGFVALGLIVFTLIAQLNLPKGLPGAAVAVIGGTVIYYILHFVGIEPIADSKLPYFDLSVTLPGIHEGTFAFLGRAETWSYMPVAVPFGLLTIIGGINLVAAAKAVGDEYKTKDILMTESLATVLAGVFGGVSQSTPYIGHGAYKAMGARIGYTVATGLVIGLGGFFGLVSFMIELIPKAAVTPILMFIGFEICVLAYRSVPRRHMLATTFAIIPSIIHFGYTQINTALGNLGGMLRAKGLDFNPMDPAVLAGVLPNGIYFSFQAMANGWIITAMVWGAAVAYLIDRRFLQVTWTFISAAAMTTIGFMHSATPDARLYVPWDSELFPVMTSSIPFKFTIGYLLLAGLALAYHRWSQSSPQPPFVEPPADSLE